MKILLILVIALTSIVCPLQARIGESPAQIIQRYGQPYKSGYSNHILEFHFKDYNVWVRFTDRGNPVSAYETFTRQDSRELGDDEIAAILNVNTLQSTWELAKGYDFKVWRLSSRTVEAWYRIENGEFKLTLCSDFGIDERLKFEKVDKIREEKEKAKREANRLKGF